MRPIRTQATREVASIIMEVRDHKEKGNENGSDLGAVHFRWPNGSVSPKPHRQIIEPGLRHAGEQTNV